MGIEIEHKFLLQSNDWRTEISESIEIHQGYLCRDKDRTVRVRIWNDIGKITIKNAAHQGVRKEFEYTVPMEDAQEMLQDLCEPFPIHKTRHLIHLDNHIWEVDEFHGPLDGLVIAEIELSTPNESFEKPDWVGQDVTEDHRFSNSHLSTCASLDTLTSQ